MNLTVTVNILSIRKTLNLEKVRIARALSLGFFFLLKDTPQRCFFRYNRHKLSIYASNVD
jgi:hypothetical protein